MKYRTLLSSALVRFLRTALLAYLLLGAFGWFLGDSMIFLPPASSYSDSSAITYIRNGDKQIAAIYLKNETANHTILYSHGNAVDIGRLQGLFNAFYHRGYSVLAYDYSGYGLSSGAASEQQSYADIELAYRFLVEQQGIEPATIIAYGHSVGAAVALDLAAKHELGGLVLEAPFVSAFRVMTRFRLYPFDKFANIDKLPDVDTPVYIMHSRDDRIIPFWHSRELFATASEPKRAYWLETAGHDGISASGGDFWNNLDKFIASLDNP